MFVGVRTDVGKDEFCMHRVKPESVAWYVARLKKTKKLRGEKKSTRNTHLLALSRGTSYRRLDAQRKPASDVDLL